MAADPTRSAASPSPRYRTIVADPPWPYGRKWGNNPSPAKRFAGGALLPLPYATLSVPEIAALPVRDIVHEDGAHLYLWTTNRFLPDAFAVLDAWGFGYSQLLVWCKAPRGKGPGGAFAQNAEFVLFARCRLPITNERVDSVWFNWTRTSHHSQKPEVFLDLVEQVSPAPRLEMFSRRARLGWDTWGDEALHGTELIA